MGNFWISERRGKTTKFFPRKKQSLSVISGVIRKKKKSQSAPSFKLIKLQTFTSLLCLNVNINKHYNIKRASKHQNTITNNFSIIAVWLAEKLPSFENMGGRGKGPRSAMPCNHTCLGMGDFQVKTSPSDSPRCRCSVPLKTTTENSTLTQTDIWKLEHVLIKVGEDW